MRYLAQVYAALAYYHSHQCIIDSEIEALEQQEKCLETEYLQTRKFLSTSY